MGELQYGESTMWGVAMYAFCGICKVFKLRCGGVVVDGSCDVGESQLVGVIVVTKPDSARRMVTIVDGLPYSPNCE